MAAQRKQILKYLQSHKSGISSKEAYDKFGVTRLASDIYYLKKQGWKIVSELQTVKARSGLKTRIARYRMGI